MKKIVLIAALAAALPALAQQITVVNFGGANGDAQKKAFYEPFEKTGTKVVPVEYNGEQAKIKAMVDTKNVTWDVVEQDRIVELVVRMTLSVAFPAGRDDQRSSTATTP